MFSPASSNRTAKRWDARSVSPFPETVRYSWRTMLEIRFGESPGRRQHCGLRTNGIAHRRLTADWETHYGLRTNAESTRGQFAVVSYLQLVSLCAVRRRSAVPLVR